jgi:hypothetical protein
MQETPVMCFLKYHSPEYFGPCKDDYGVAAINKKDWKLPLPEYEKKYAKYIQECFSDLYCREVSSESSNSNNGDNNDSNTSIATIANENSNNNNNEDDDDDDEQSEQQIDNNSNNSNNNNNNNNSSNNGSNGSNNTEDNDDVEVLQPTCDQHFQFSDPFPTILHQK